MKLIEKLLTINPYTRSGRLLQACKGFVFHYVGIPGQRAVDTWSYFEKNCPSDKHFSSAHYIIDLNGDIFHIVPDTEAAWHCGSDKPDPVSGRIYTNWARQIFGYYASDPVRTSPNNCSIGIELCIDKQFNFTPETLQAAVELAVKLLKENRLNVEQIGHHKLVVGWKDCPLPWVRELLLFENFLNEVRDKMGVLL